MANYNTIQKQSILELLEEHKNKHLNVDEMMSLLYERKENVSRATLYRTLDNLVQNGIVRKFTIQENEKACYQIIDEENCHNHFHLVCSNCGKLIHLECDKFEDILKHFETDHGFTVFPSRVVLYGLCSECQEKGGNKNA